MYGGITVKDDPINQKNGLRFQQMLHENLLSICNYQYFCKIKIRDVNSKLAFMKSESTLKYHHISYIVCIEVWVDSYTHKAFLGQGHM